MRRGSPGHCLVSVSAGLSGTTFQLLADHLSPKSDPKPSPILSSRNAGLMPSALENEALAGGLSARLSDMRVRLERLETRARRKRKLAFQAMSEAEIAKLT